MKFCLFHFRGQEQLVGNAIAYFRLVDYQTIRIELEESPFIGIEHIANKIVLLPDLNKFHLIFFCADISNQLATRVATLLSRPCQLNLTGLTQNYVMRLAISALYEVKYNLTEPYCLTVSSIPHLANSSIYSPTGVCHINNKTHEISIVEHLNLPVNASITHASMVLIMGMGIQDHDFFNEMVSRAQACKMEVGITRPAALNAWLPMSQLVGISGHMIAPKLCITAGVSGASAFMYGIKSSQKIIAINTDNNAPIFEQADVGIVGDAKDILPNLLNYFTEGNDNG